MRTLETALCRYDGKAITILGQIQAEFGADPAYLDGLLEAVRHSGPNVASGATWLLLDHVNSGGALTPDQTETLVGAFAALTDWSARLHIAQMIRHLNPPKASRRILAAELTEHLTHERPFLRAWSLDALVHLAKIDPAYTAEAQAALAAAQEDPAASVRARARNLT